ncbi:MAG: hypothetical protein Q9164_000607 [Protoblastenia rupestris]
MAATRRKSSRIGGVHTPSRNNVTPATNTLSSLLERDESPNNDLPNIDALVSSPVVVSSTPKLARYGTFNSIPKTPKTASRELPSEGEKHPSKPHQSLAKASVSRGSLSAHPANSLPRSPSKIAIAVGSHHTPAKAKTSVPQNMTSPTFDFSFERPESDLSAEGQKIMDSVREEAAKIKAQMVEERSKQEHKDGEVDQLYGVGGRQIRKATGKSGRFSDVHKQEFRKLDSIANHVSTWKHTPHGTASSPLKRSPSKAGLDEMSKSLPRSNSFKKFCNIATDRLENTAPGKRAKRLHDEDTSSARPSSRDTTSGHEGSQTTPAKVHPISGLPSVMATPTKASLARSASAKSFKTSMIPSLTRSASTKTLTSPIAPKTEGSNKRIGSWSKFSGSMKSILHRSQPKFSNDPSKVAAGTHLPLHAAKLDVDKDLPSLPSLPDTPTIKRVNFTSSTKSRHELATASNTASASKIPKMHTNQGQNYVAVTSNVAPLANEKVSYPDLDASSNITTRSRSPELSTSPSAGPENFTFRADKTITFEPIGFTSPNGTFTIRQVQPSGIHTSMPGTFDAEMPAIPHGMYNKKRKHVSSDEDDETENVDPQIMKVDVQGQDGLDGQPNTKKQRVTGPSLPTKAMQARASPSKRRMTATGIGGSRAPKKGGLTLSRLNLLAKPKQRR